MEMFKLPALTHEELPVFYKSLAMFNFEGAWFKRNC